MSVLPVIIIFPTGTTVLPEKEDVDSKTCRMTPAKSVQTGFVGEVGEIGKREISPFDDRINFPVKLA